MRTPAATRTHFITNIATQTVSGTLSAALGGGETVQVSTNGTTWVDATTTGTTWSVALTLPAGSGSLSVRTIDTASTTAAGTGHAFTLDTTAPAAPTIVQIGGLDSIIGSGSETADHTITGTTDACTTVALNFGTGRTAIPATVTGTTWSYTLLPADIAALGQGSGKTITATATDLGGNSAVTTSAPFGVDAVAPNAPTIGVISGIVNSGQVITGTTDAGTTVALKLLPGQNRSRRDGHRHHLELYPDRGRHHRARPGPRQDLHRHRDRPRRHLRPRHLRVVQRALQPHRNYHQGNGR